MEELIRALGTAENKAIKIAMADRHHVNRCFDLLGLVYPDWPSKEPKDSEVGKNKKQVGADDIVSSTSKRGGRGRGCAGESMVDCVAASKVASLSMSTARLVATVSLVPRLSMVGGLCLAVKCQVFLICLFCMSS